MDDGGVAGPIIMISGELVALGPLRRELVPTYQRWLNDFAALRNRGRPPAPTTTEAQQAQYERLSTAEQQYFFTVYERAAARPIGEAGLHGLDLRHGTAFFAITIGEAAYRGRGYGTEATRLILDYAFTALGLHSVRLEVYEYNLAGLRAYSKAGFREVGRWRQCHWMGGQHWDAICMDCLASEFVSPVLGAIFVPDAPREQGE
jgi:RimJ/RimL family protein N-acetyltransferase